MNTNNIREKRIQCNVISRRGTNLNESSFTKLDPSDMSNIPHGMVEKFGAVLIEIQKTISTSRGVIFVLCKPAADAETDKNKVLQNFGTAGIDL